MAKKEHFAVLLTCLYALYILKATREMKLSKYTMVSISEGTLNSFESKRYLNVTNL